MVAEQCSVKICGKSGRQRVGAWKSGEMALFDKISTKCSGALQWIGPQFEKGTSVFNRSKTLTFPKKCASIPNLKAKLSTLTLTKKSAM